MRTWVWSNIDYRRVERSHLPNSYRGFFVSKLPSFYSCHTASSYHIKKSLCIRLNGCCSRWFDNNEHNYWNQVIKSNKIKYLTRWMAAWSLSTVSIGSTALTRNTSVVKLTQRARTDRRRSSWSVRPNTESKPNSVELSSYFTILKWQWQRTRWEKKQANEKGWLY